MKFTLEPPNPSYARNGSNAKLVWDYSVDDKQKELKVIRYSVQISGGAFTVLLAQRTGGTAVENPNIPPAYKGRVRIEGNASLIIENVTPRDNTRFLCELIPKSGQGLIQVSVVQLVITGKFILVNDGCCMSTHEYHCLSHVALHEIVHQIAF